MNQQEVNEYMQRFLDDDLSEEEAAKLESYLEQSPANAALFERLKRLNSELEQLPRVTPPASIVDSILPRLDNIALPDETDADAEALSADGRSRITASSGRDHGAVQPRRPRKRFTWVAAGSVAVAGIALIVWIAGLPNMTFQTADNAAHMGAGASSSANSAELYDMPAGEEASGTMESAVSGITSPPRADEGADEAPDEAPRKMNTFGAVDPDAPVSDNLSVPRQAGDDSLRGGSSPGFAGESDMEFGSAGLPAAISPDESLFAQVETDFASGQRIRIFDRDGREIYLSQSYEGSIGVIGWSADSSLLEFDVTDADGTKTVRMIIDLKDKTETVKKE